MVFEDPSFSPANTCIWSFNFPKEAKLGDLLVVEVENIRRADIFYA